MIIRKAENRDLDAINELLCQVLMVHYKGRPDLFKPYTKKYNDEEIIEIINDEKKPVFIAEIDGVVLGYAFCVEQQHLNNSVLTDIKTLYIDDLCVNESARGKHIGKALYEYVLEYAKNNGFYNVTLNVWSCNENAQRFYEKMGMKPQKTGMEIIL